MIKIIRSSTVPLSLNLLLKGQLRFLNKSFDVIALSGEGVDLQTVKDREGVEVIPCTMARQISPVQDLKSLINLYLIFKKEKPNIVHSITPKAGLLSMLAAKMAGVPIRMHTFTGLVFPARAGLMQKLLIKMDQLLCWAATDIYPEGKGVMEDLLRYKISNKPLKILANGNINGVDLIYYDPSLFVDEQYRIKKQLNIKRSDFVFIFVGRLVRDKGINELVEAFLKLNLKNTKLLLVGAFENELDPLHVEVLRKIKESSDIISVGFQQDVRPFFGISDALVFPSHREGFPNVVLQAGAMELPSIVSDINGCNEIIIEGQNGTIIPAKDIETLIEAMRNFVEKKEYYDNLKQNARKLISSRYEQSVVWNALSEEYITLLKQRGLLDNYV